MLVRSNVASGRIQWFQSTPPSGERSDHNRPKRTKTMTSTKVSIHAPLRREERHVDRM